MLFLLEYPVGHAAEERALYAHPSPLPFMHQTARNCPPCLAICLLSIKFFVESNFQLYLHFKSYLLYKLGEIRGDRNRHNQIAFAEVYG